MFNTQMPIFPQVQTHPDGCSVYYYGMSLRDYFAATALPALLNTPIEDWPEGIDTLSVSEAAYVLADKMIEVRNA